MTTLVWSEREAGDWEACVVSSGLTALVYGGITAFPLGIYSQAEREACEPVKDEPMTYPLLDVAFPKRYGVKLRPLTVSTIAAAVQRPGVGLLLSGPGFPYTQWPGSKPTFHSVFYVPTSAADGLLYDPMAANKSPGVKVASTVISKWAKGAGANDAREVREGEFGVTEVTISPFPEGTRKCTIAAGATVQGYNSQKLVKSQAWPTGSSFPADATAIIVQTPPRAPQGTFRRCTAGVYAGLYVPASQVTLAPAPPPASPDCSAATAPLNVQIATLTGDLATANGKISEARQALA